MPRTSDLEQRRFVFECAWHLSLGVTVGEIVAATGKSAPTVYRALEHARAWKWLDDSPRLTMPPGEERTELEQEMADFYKADQVRDVFGRKSRPQEVIVAPAPADSPEERLSAAVCGAMRRAEPFQNIVWGGEVPGWEEALPGLVEAVSAAEEVRAARPARDALRDLVRHHLGRPFSDREIERSRRVGRATAARFCRAVAEGQVKSVGVSWGYHVRDFVRAVRVPFPAYGGRGGSGDPLPRNARTLRIFPLIGSVGREPALDAGQGTASGAYANCAELASKMGAPAPVALTQPAYIPEAFHAPEQLRNIWRYVQEDLSIRLIFGPDLADRRIDENGHPLPDPAEAPSEDREPGPASGGYLAEADALITGVGACAADSRAPRVGILTALELAQIAATGACGDISGRFYWDPASPPPEANKDHIREVNSRVIGPCLGDFTRATLRAREEGNGALGTVVVASGEEKARALERLCHWRAANLVVIDSDLATSIVGGV